MRELEGFTKKRRKRMTMDVIGYLLEHPESWASAIADNIEGNPEWEASAVNSVLYMNNRNGGLFRYKSPSDKRWSVAGAFVEAANAGGGYWKDSDGIHAGALLYPWRMPDEEPEAAPIAQDAQIQIEMRRLGFEVLPNNYDTVQQARERVSGWSRKYGQLASSYNVDRLALIDVLVQRFHKDQLVIFGPTEDFGKSGAEVFEDRARYHVLQIDRPDYQYRAAVAVSPANGHGVYVTRSDAVNRDWESVLRGARVDARGAGARSLKFSASHSGLGPVDALALRVIAYLECSPEDFADHENKKLWYDRYAQQYFI